MADTQAASTGGKTKAPAKKAVSKANGKKPAATSARKTVTKAKAPTPAKAKQGPISSPTVSSEERWRMVAEAAYLRAEKRGFTGGNPTDDWLAAEAEVDKLLAAKK